MGVQKSHYICKINTYNTSCGHIKLMCPQASSALYGRFNTRCYVFIHTFCLYNMDGVEEF